MRRCVAVLVAFGCLAATAACEVTGVAAPSGAYAHDNANGLQYPGEPGYNAP